MAKSFNLKFPKMPKVPKMDKLLNDKNVLYIVFVIAILNLLGYLMVKNTEAVVFFLIVGFLTTYFSKNMIVVLMITITATSIFAASRGRVLYGKEGLKNKSKKVTDDKKDNKEDKEDKEEGNESKGKKENKDTEEDLEEDIEEGMVSLQPAEVSTISNKKNRVDYAGTLEDAYKNLQKTVGEGGIKGLTGQTAGLLAQQKELMDNIKGMQPFLTTADSFMKNLDMSSLEGITGMLGKLTGKSE